MTNTTIRPLWLRWFSDYSFATFPPDHFLNQEYSLPCGQQIRSRSSLALPDRIERTIQLYGPERGKLQMACQDRCPLARLHRD